MQQPKQVEKNIQPVITKKIVRDDGDRVGFSVLWYATINFAITMIWLYAEVQLKFSAAAANITDTAEREKMYDNIFNYISKHTGTCMIVGVVVGILFLFLYYRKSGVNKQLFKSENKMTPARFGALACVLFGGHLVFQLVYMLLEAGLNPIGYTAQGSLESATVDSDTISKFVYVGIIAPVGEELVYRGFVMRSLDKYGKTLAVVVSSILFAVMHANLPQGLFTFFAGLVLGYAAVEYSIVWSIVLHILNNMVLGDLMPMLMGNFSATVQNTVFYLLMGTFLVIGIIVIIRKRKEIGAWIKNNMWEKPRMRWIMITFGMILFIASHLVMAVMSLEKLRT